MLSSPTLRRSRFAALPLVALAAIITIAGSPRSQSTTAKAFERIPRRDAPASVQIAGERTVVMLTADFDQDGDLDVFLARKLYSYGNAQNRMLRNDGFGRFTDTTATDLPASPDLANAAATGDLDGDGDLDLVVATGSSIRVLLNDGAGTFSLHPQQLGVAGQYVELADVDGDGDLDGILGPLDILLINDGTGLMNVVLGALTLRIDQSSDIAVGDFDGDGDVDIATSNLQIYDPVTGTSVPGTTALFLNNGSGFFLDMTATNMPPHDGLNHTLAAADFDGDGDLDLAVAGTDVCGPGYPCAAPVLIMQNNGSGVFTMTASVLAPVHDLAADDIDGDGDIDLVLACTVTPNPGDGQNRVLLNDGSGTFSDATASYAPTASQQSLSTALADFDGDGDIDWCVGEDGTVAILTNVRHQLDAPLQPQTGQAYLLDTYLRVGSGSGLDAAAIWLATAPANVPLPPFGILGIDPATAAPLAAVAIPVATGRASASLAIPAQPTLIGLPLYAQAVILDAGLDIRLSNVDYDTIH